MTNENKQLLLIDLCARLPYGVKFEFTSGNVRIAKGIDLGVTDEGEWEYFVTSKGASEVEITEIKPYLRPMSSMTEEEEIYYNTIYTILKFYEKEDWLNAHHFDYRGLIEKGLALEAPEDMYKTE